jgi:hypothetical protein
MRARKCRSVRTTRSSTYAATDGSRPSGRAVSCRKRRPRCRPPGRPRLRERRPRHRRWGRPRLTERAAGPADAASDDPAVAVGDGPAVTCPADALHDGPAVAVGDGPAVAERAAGPADAANDGPAVAVEDGPAIIKRTVSPADTASDGPAVTVGDDPVVTERAAVLDGMRLSPPSQAERAADAALRSPTKCSADGVKQFLSEYPADAAPPSPTERAVDDRQSAGRWGMGAEVPCPACSLQFLLPAVLAVCGPRVRLRQRAPESTACPHMMQPPSAPADRTVHTTTCTGCRMRREAVTTRAALRIGSAVGLRDGPRHCVLCADGAYKHARQRDGVCITV